MDEKVFSLMEKMYAEILNLKEGQGTLEHGQRKLEEDIRRLGVKIDGDITPKISALYDDRIVIHEKLNEVDGKIDDLQVKVNNLSLETLMNSNKIIEWDKKLKRTNL
ncbi:hypothetical protein KQI89_06020 [Clostridium sp. MSJ-4]|uniref:Uncharacterized protein n=1 Tax=Clostridium simiarum TaxID=2841506 RepID=A0ABS6EYM8_9CLOT|nr:hypothetical protein [Clostridium simiarum]MBU5591312.1 hypothetical protein [Clostridium simiarum]